MAFVWCFLVLVVIRLDLLPGRHGRNTMSKDSLRKYAIQQ